MIRTLPLALSLCCAWPALANDTTAVLSTGGLVFVRSDVVAMEKEELYVSPSEVRVAYRFRNMSGEDVESIVAFPMPEIQGEPDLNVAVPDSQSDNFLGFEVEVDGRRIAPQLEQKAFAVGLDVTLHLDAAGVPLNPFAEATYEALARLPRAVTRDWEARGIVQRSEYDAGKGPVEEIVPVWAMKSTYWWRMTFPSRKAVDVRHRYQPSVGGTVGVTFFYDGKPSEPTLAEYRHKYCLEDSIVRAMSRSAARDPDGFPPFTENWISYVLTTGGNWAGSIEDFRLTVDKEHPDNLVSFCGENVRKVGPTTFEMRATDFYPTRDLEILLLRRHDANRGAALDEPDDGAAE